MPTSANCPKTPSDVRADVGIRAPILPLSQQPLTSSLQEFFQPLLDFRTRQGALRERRVTLRQHSFVKRNAELHDRTVGWFSVQHGKQRVLRLGEFAGALV